MAKTPTDMVTITIFRYPTHTVAPQSSDVTPRRPEKYIAKTHTDVTITNISASTTKTTS